MIKLILLVAFYLLFPAVILLLCHKWSFFQRMGSVVLAYIFGLVLGNLGVIPHGSELFHESLAGRPSIPAEEIESLISQGSLQASDLYVNQLMSVQDLILTIVVPLAIPLLLFSLNFKKWLKQARRGILSMVLALISVVAVVIVSHLLFKKTLSVSWQVSGMLIGIYSGGTPNLAAIRTALDVDPNTFILTHTYDMITGAVLLIFMLSVGQRFFNLFLPKYKSVDGGNNTEEMMAEASELDNYQGILRKENRLSLFKALGLAILIFAVAGGVSLLFNPMSQMMIVILLITTFGILLSLIPSINRIQKSFQLGMYLILIFCLVVSSMADLRYMIRIEYLNLFLLVAMVVYGSLILHALLSALFRIDTDNFLITTTALVYSPPFVPAVAGALKNKEVILTGLTVGILGYAIGNYLGVAVGLFLKGL